MPQWLSYLLIFIGGLLFTYIFQLFDLGMQHLVNNQTLKASKMQKEIDGIDGLNGNETPELQSAIGFQYQQEQENYDEE